MIKAYFTRSKTPAHGSLTQLQSFTPRQLLTTLAMLTVLAAGLLAGVPAVQAQEPVGSGEAATININTADAQTLAAGLKGVGESRALEIIRYREAYGPFASAEELTEVKGIGQSTLDMNLQVITLE